MSKSLLFMSVVCLFFAPLKRITEPVDNKVNHTRADAMARHKEAIIRTKPAFITPTIVVTAANGTISACTGSASVSMQQFTVSGNNLTDNITVNAPAGFEISINPAGGFTNLFFLVTSGSTVTTKTVYVRAVAGVPANLSGTVTLTSAGATTKKVAVKGVINVLPTVDPVSDYTYTNGDLTTPVKFTGTGNTFYWSNDKPGIGLPASGRDNIAPFIAVNTGSSPVVANISVTAKKANVAYIPDFNTNTVLAVNTITNKITDTIPVGPSPGLVAISPDGAKVYVGSLGSNSISMINTQTKAVKNLPVFDTPSGMVFSRDGTRAYVAGAGGQCTVIDVTNDATLTSFTFFSGGAGVTLSNDGKWIYATNYAMSDVRVYDTSNGAEVGYIPAPGANYAVTSPDGKKVYAAGSFARCIYVIDAATAVLSSTINLAGDAAAIAVSPDGSRIYVTNQAAGTVTVINAANNAIIVTLPVGKSPEGISITPDGKYVYVVNVDSGTISIINTADYTVATTISCGQYPRALGSFISPGINDCLGNPTNFKITVNPSATTITPGAVGGLITACIGAPSTNTQQFTVSGNNLPGNITATSPAGFEISFSQTTGFADILTLIQTGGAVTNKVIYVRAKASGTPAKLSGNVTLTAPGAATKNVAVKGVVNDLPTTDAADNPVYNNGDITTEIKFTGTANTYTWTNDKPVIGLAASGTGDIPSFTAINTGTAPIKANIVVTPSSDGYLYLTGPNNMAMVNVDQNKQVWTINTGGQPVGVTVSPDGTLVAISDIGTNSVKFINTTTHKVVATVGNISSPIGICFSADGKKVYVVNNNTSTVSVIDVATAKAEQPIIVGWAPYGIAASPDGLTVYVGSQGQNAVIAIDTKTRQTTPINVTFGPTGIAVSPDNSRVYATSAQYNGSLKVIDAASKSVIANIPVGDVSTGLCVSPDGKRVYVSNTLSNSVMVIDAELNKVITTIPVANRPVGISVTPDGKYVYAISEGSGNVNIISTATNTIVNSIQVTGPLTKSFGNFFVPGTECTGTPTKFTITVNGLAAITASTVTGTISTCAGSASINTQQFKVTGNNLSDNITATAPPNFEVSLSETSGFANSVIITQTGGTVTDQTVYVRAAASGATGSISGNVVLSSTGITNKNIAINGVINALPIANPVTDKNFNNAEVTTPINFTGTATTYSWTNDTPSIGLPASGNGNIPSFTVINGGQTVVTATITVTPSDAQCSGNAITFKINVNPTPPSLTTSTVTGSIKACEGSASINPDLQQFSVSGSALTANVLLTAPVNFEISLNATTGYAGSLSLVQTAGKVNNTVIFVRSAALAPAGNVSGNIVLSSAGLTDQNVPVSGVVTALPVVNQLSTQTFNNGAATTPISFTGTATSYTWANDNPAIGLSSNGNGDIPSFTAVNNGQTILSANITVTPLNASCSGSTITFKININPNPPSLTAGIVTGNITACLGTASANPDIQQFSLSGNNLTGNVLLTAPPNFELSLNPTVGYNTTITLIPTTIGSFNNAIVYVRSAASAPAGTVSGAVTIFSPGAPGKTVNVSGIIKAPPVANLISPLTFDNGSATTTINFSGGATTYNWINDLPAIGLPAGGSGNIPSFTAVNNTAAPIIATITVVPSNGSCVGNPMQFQITVNPPPPPVITSTGNLSALTTVYGSPSSQGNFTVSGRNLVSGVVITPPAGFEVSSDGVNFSNTITVGGTGTLNATTVYIRLAKTTFVGNYVGVITISTTNGTTGNLLMANSTVTPAPVIVKADNKTRSVKQENPALTITYNGFVNNESEAILTTKPQLQTEATTASAAGNYVINFIGEAESGNYSFTYVPGILTVISVDIVIYNTFTPNGDGKNDTWAIKNIENYPKCTVNVFNRWGAKVFSSIGYGQQWNGHWSGNPVPVGTYYYVINLSDGSAVKTGWVAIVR